MSESSCAGASSSTSSSSSTKATKPKTPVASASSSDASSAASSSTTSQTPSSSSGKSTPRSSTPKAGRPKSRSKSASASSKGSKGSKISKASKNSTKSSSKIAPSSPAVASRAPLANLSPAYCYFYASTSVVACVNSVMQGDYVTGESLERLEGLLDLSTDLSGGQGVPPSKSLMLLQLALRNFGLSCINLSSEAASQARTELSRQGAFICASSMPVWKSLDKITPMSKIKDESKPDEDDRFFVLRNFDGIWLNLSGVQANGPTVLLGADLGNVLSELISDGNELFVVAGKFPPLPNAREALARQHEQEKGGAGGKRKKRKGSKAAEAESKVAAAQLQAINPRVVAQNGAKRFDVADVVKASQKRGSYPPKPKKFPLSSLFDIAAQVDPSHVKAENGASSAEDPITAKSEEAIGGEFVGRGVQVLWPADDCWYSGFLADFSHVSKHYRILYDDGGFEWIDLRSEVYRFCESNIRTQMRAHASLSVAAAPIGSRAPASPLKDEEDDEVTEVERRRSAPAAAAKAAVRHPTYEVKLPSGGSVVVKASVEEKEALAKQVKGAGPQSEVLAAVANGVKYGAAVASHKQSVRTQSKQSVQKPQSNGSVSVSSSAQDASQRSRPAPAAKRMNGVAKSADSPSGAPSSAAKSSDGSSTATALTRASSSSDVHMADASRANHSGGAAPMEDDVESKSANAATSETQEDKSRRPPTSKSVGASASAHDGVQDVEMADATPAVQKRESSRGSSAAKSGEASSNSHAKKSSDTKSGAAAAVADLSVKDQRDRASRGGNSSESGSPDNEDAAADKSADGKRSSKNPKDAVSSKSSERGERCRGERKTAKADSGPARSSASTSPKSCSSEATGGSRSESASSGSSGEDVAGKSSKSSDGVPAKGNDTLVAPDGRPSSSDALNSDSSLSSAKSRSSVKLPEGKEDAMKSLKKDESKSDGEATKQAAKDATNVQQRKEDVTGQLNDDSTEDAAKHSKSAAAADLVVDTDESDCEERPKDVATKRIPSTKPPRAKESPPPEAAGKPSCVNPKGGSESSKLQAADVEAVSSASGSCDGKPKATLADPAKDADAAEATSSNNTKDGKPTSPNGKAPLSGSSKSDNKGKSKATVPTATAPTLQNEKTNNASATAAAAAEPTSTDAKQSKASATAAAATASPPVKERKKLKRKRSIHSPNVSKGSGRKDAPSSKSSSKTAKSTSAATNKGTRSSPRNKQKSSDISSGKDGASELKPAEASKSLAEGERPPLAASEKSDASATAAASPNSSAATGLGTKAAASASPDGAADETPDMVDDDGLSDAEIVYNGPSSAARSGAAASPSPSGSSASSSAAKVGVQESAAPSEGISVTENGGTQEAIQSGNESDHAKRKAKLPSNNAVSSGPAVKPKLSKELCITAIKASQKHVPNSKLSVTNSITSNRSSSATATKAESDSPREKMRPADSPKTTPPGESAAAGVLRAPQTPKSRAAAPPATPAAAAKIRPVFAKAAAASGKSAGVRVPPPPPPTAAGRSNGGSGSGSGRRASRASVPDTSSPDSLTITMKLQHAKTDARHGAGSPQPTWAIAVSAPHALPDSMLLYLHSVLGATDLKTYKGVYPVASKSSAGAKQAKAGGPRAGPATPQTTEKHFAVATGIAPDSQISLTHFRGAYKNASVRNPSDSAKRGQAASSSSADDSKSPLKRESAQSFTAAERGGAVPYAPEFSDEVYREALHPEDRVRVSKASQVGWETAWATGKFDAKAHKFEVRFPSSGRTEWIDPRSRDVKHELPAAKRRRLNGTNPFAPPLPHTEGATTPKANSASSLGAALPHTQAAPRGANMTVAQHFRFAPHMLTAPARAPAAAAVAPAATAPHTPAKRPLPQTTPSAGMAHDPHMQAAVLGYAQQLAQAMAAQSRAAAVAMGAMAPSLPHQSLPQPKVLAGSTKELAMDLTDSSDEAEPNAEAVAVATSAAATPQPPPHQGAAKRQKVTAHSSPSSSAAAAAAAPNSTSSSNTTGTVAAGGAAKKKAKPPAKRKGGTPDVASAPKKKRGRPRKNAVPPPPPPPAPAPAPSAPRSNGTTAAGAPSGTNRAVPNIAALSAQQQCAQLAAFPLAGAPTLLQPTPVGGTRLVNVPRGVVKAHALAQGARPPSQVHEPPPPPPPGPPSRFARGNAARRGALVPKNTRMRQSSFVNVPPRSQQPGGMHRPPVLLQQKLAGAAQRRLQLNMVRVQNASVPAVYGANPSVSVSSSVNTYRVASQPHAPAISSPSGAPSIPNTPTSTQVSSTPTASQQVPTTPTVATVTQTYSAQVSNESEANAAASAGSSSLAGTTPIVGFPLPVTGLTHSPSVTSSAPASSSSSHGGVDHTPASTSSLNQQAVSSASVGQLAASTSQGDQHGVATASVGRIPSGTSPDGQHATGTSSTGQQTPGASSPSHVEHTPGTSSSLRAQPHAPTADADAQQAPAPTADVDAQQQQQRPSHASSESLTTFEEYLRACENLGHPVRRGNLNSFCRWCGARGSFGWGEGPWGKRTLCRIHARQYKENTLIIDFRTPEASSPSEVPTPEANTEIEFVSRCLEKARQKIEMDSRVANTTPPLMAGGKSHDMVGHDSLEKFLDTECDPGPPQTKAQRKRAAAAAAAVSAAASAAAAKAIAEGKPPPPAPSDAANAAEVAAAISQHAGAPADPANDPNVEYVVEAILDSKLHNGTEYFLIKWDGYDSSENTWEAEANLGKCNLMLATFRERQRDKLRKRREMQRQKSRKRRLRDRDRPASAASFPPSAAASFPPSYSSFSSTTASSVTSSFGAYASAAADDADDAADDEEQQHDVPGGSPKVGAANASASQPAEDDKDDEDGFLVSPRREYSPDTDYTPTTKKKKARTSESPPKEDESPQDDEEDDEEMDEVAEEPAEAAEPRSMVVSLPPPVAKEVAKEDEGEGEEDEEDGDEDDDEDDSPPSEDEDSADSDFSAAGAEEAAAAEDDDAEEETLSLSQRKRKNLRKRA